MLTLIYFVKTNAFVNFSFFLSFVLLSSLVIFFIDCRGNNRGKHTILDKPKKSEQFSKLLKLTKQKNSPRASNNNNTSKSKSTSNLYNSDYHDNNIKIRPFDPIPKPTLVDRPHPIIATAVIDIDPLPPHKEHELLI